MDVNQAQRPAHADKDEGVGVRRVRDEHAITLVRTPDGRAKFPHFEINSGAVHHRRPGAHVQHEAGAGAAERNLDLVWGAERIVDIGVVVADVAVEDAGKHHGLGIRISGKGLLARQERANRKQGD